MKIKCLDCDNISDIEPNKGMIRFSKTWIFYCIKCESTNVEYYNGKLKEPKEEPLEVGLPYTPPNDKGQK